ncbi:MAG: outer membrane protein assembly factor BamE, partial [Lautropia sp.]|nr:outer membrane protein assembly factor BamE [Lautropia sp.]
MSPRFKRPVAAGLVLVAGMALLAGCASNRNSSGLLSPYRTAIPQGNYINQQMLDEVREGMSPDDVRLRIGTPLLA